MKNKFKMIILAVGVIATMSNCALTLPVNATSNPIGSKVGRAKATGYLGVIFLGQDASIATAARNGGITKISTVDIKQSTFLGLIVSYETIVTGE